MSTPLVASCDGPDTRVALRRTDQQPLRSHALHALRVQLLGGRHGDAAAHYSHAAFDIAEGVSPCAYTTR